MNKHEPHKKRSEVLQGKVVSRSTCVTHERKHPAANGRVSMSDRSLSAPVHTRMRHQEARQEHVAGCDGNFL